MQRLLRLAGALSVVAGLLAGCGSGGGSGTGSGQAATTSSQAPASGGASANTRSEPETAPGETGAGTSSTSSSDSGGSEAPASTSASTRSAPEPAFAEGSSSAEGEALKAAQRTLSARGYSAGEAAQFHEHQTLQVLVGTRTGSSDGYGQQAFFFIDGHFLGTDASEPSATVRVLSQAETEVTLAYPLYAPGDALGSPSGGQATVRFQLDNGKLQALGAIPSASPSAALSRR